MLERIGTKSNVKKDRARNPMLERRGPEFNVKKDRARNPMLERIRLEC